MDKMIATKTAYSSVVGQSVSIVSESGPMVALLTISVPNVQYDYKPTADMIADKVVAAFNDADSLARRLLALEAVVEAARAFDMKLVTHFSTVTNAAGNPWRSCRICAWVWRDGEPEQHAADCVVASLRQPLAALDNLKEGR